MSEVERVIHCEGKYWGHKFRTALLRQASCVTRAECALAGHPYVKPWVDEVAPRGIRLTGYCPRCGAKRA